MREEEEEWRPTVHAIIYALGTERGRRGKASGTGRAPYQAMQVGRSGCWDRTLIAQLPRQTGAATTSSTHPQISPAPPLSLHTLRSTPGVAGEVGAQACGQCVATAQQQEELELDGRAWLVGRGHGQDLGGRWASEGDKLACCDWAIRRVRLPALSGEAQTGCWACAGASAASDHGPIHISYYAVPYRPALLASRPIPSFDRRHLLPAVFVLTDTDVHPLPAPTDRLNSDTPREE